MQKSQLPKPMSYNIGRTFNLLFNRISMYHLDHPATVQGIEDFLKALREGFRLVPSVSFIMLHDKFYLEEQPFDTRINTSKMLPHFKKANIQSLLFARGLSEPEVRGFLKVFSDLKTYPTAESITTALNQLEISHLKVNHTFLQKMTQDDQVISRETLAETLSPLTKTADGIGTDALKEVLTEQIILEELEKSLSLHTLVEDPTKFSQALVQAELSQQKGENVEAGFIVSQQLRQINQEVDQTSTATKQVDLLRIADSIFTMKKNLIEELKAQKALGVVFSHEEMILKETNALTDQVFVRIVREEYNQGEISIPRLAQIIRRLLPEPGEIKRLLPLLKEALLAEGMSLVEFLRLIQELGKELENEGLVQVIKESAEHIGLSGEDLIKEVKRDPGGAAELIFLAAEIRRGSGDDKVFCELLANYVEQIGSEFALDAATQKGEGGGKHLKEVISQVESELLSRLNGKIDSQLMNMVGQRLDDHLEEVLKQTTSAWVTRKISLSDDASIELPALLTLIEENIDDDDDIQIILEKIISSLRARGFEEDKLKIIADEIAKRAQKQEKKPEKKGYPKGTFNRGNILFFLKKEISRAWRYKVPFSTITLSLVNIIPQQPVSSEKIELQEILFSVSERLIKIMRDTDLLGFLEENKILLLLPMTDENGSKLALQRLLRILHSESFVVENIPLELKFVALTTSFHQDNMPTIQIFLKEIETKMNELLKIQKNVKLNL
ncbi:MAG: hypothetical protein H6Q46_170 [Deltaproteobacteria bacterium]|nr:hypothetical protein [Deltaproteobacteria bacterium]